MKKQMKKLSLNTQAIKIGIASAMGVSALFMATSIHAQAWPDKPVKIVIPFPPGGTLDKVGRLLAQNFTEQFKQNFVVENKPGGNGTIGGNEVAKANSDGYTLLFNASTFVTAPMTLKGVPYKVQTDFAPIGLVASAPLSVALSNQMGVRDIRSLVATAKTKPGKLNFAVGSIGSAGHLCTVKLEGVTGTDFTIIPYKGTTPAVTDLMGGQIDGFVDPVLGTIGQHKSDRLRVVAVTSTKRLANLPDVPTVAETIPGFECSSWYGLWAPAKTPADIVQRLNTAINKALEGDLKEKLLADGIVLGGGSVADFTKFQDADIAASAKIIADKKISVE